MKELFNFCPVSGYGYDKSKCFDFIKKMNLDGIELFMYENKPFTESFKPYVIGIHLRYWPDWLGFWLGEKTDARYITQKDWLAEIKANIQQALLEKPEYLVWHVSNSSFEEVFTMQYKYDSMKVVKEAAAVFNEIANIIPENVTVLFENLWHSGLKLTEPEVVEEFFACVQRKNVGIVLDTGHLMLTNQNLCQEQEAVDYIYKVLTRLGNMKSLIKGVHFTSSLDKNYRQFSITLPDNISEKILWQHIASLDRHQPFKECSFKKVFELITPDYLVHELLYKNFAQLENLIKLQRQCLK